MSVLDRVLATELTPKSKDTDPIVKLMKKLKTGDKVAVTSMGSGGSDVTKKYTVTKDWKTTRDTTEIKTLYIGIIGRGSSRGRMKGQGGYIQQDSDGLISFQPTMMTQSKQVLKLEKV